MSSLFFSSPSSSSNKSIISPMTTKIVPTVYALNVSYLNSNFMQQEFSQ